MASIPTAAERRDPGALERVVGADAGEVTGGGDDVVGVGIEDGGGAHPGRGLPPPLERVAGDDLRRARGARALHDREADAPEPEHEHGRARLDPGGVEHRADAGLHRAADDARDLERRVVGHLHRAGLVGHRVLGEATDAEAAVAPADRRATRPVEPSGKAPPNTAELFTQQPGFVAQAPVAATARRDRREHDRVAGRQHRDALADGVDDARGLVAEHRSGSRRRCCAARCSRSGRCRSGAPSPARDPGAGSSMSTSSRIRSGVPDS